MVFRLDNFFLGIVNIYRTIRREDKPSIRTMKQWYRGMGRGRRWKMVKWIRKSIRLRGNISFPIVFFRLCAKGRGHWSMVMEMRINKSSVQEEGGQHHQSSVLSCVFLMPTFYIAHPSYRGFFRNREGCNGKISTRVIGPYTFRDKAWYKLSLPFSIFSFNYKTIKIFKLIFKKYLFLKSAALIFWQNFAYYEKLKSIYFNSLIKILL